MSAKIMTPDEIRQDSMERRRVLRGAERFIVDPIFPCGALHIIGGPSGLGKTTWLTQTLYDWEQGRPVLGGKSNPCPWVYVSADRSLMDGDRTLRRLGFEEWDAPMFAMEDVIPRNSLKQIEREPAIDQIVKKFPDIDLYVIEGLQAFLPNTARGQTQNKAEQLWCMRLRDEVLNKGKTIIAVTHSPKMTEGYRHNRENFLGSQALIGAAGTLISFNLPASAVSGTRKDGVQTTDRVVRVMGHSFPEMCLYYSAGPNGALELSARQTAGAESELYETSTDKKLTMYARLTACKPGEEVPYSAIKRWANAGMPESSMNNWLKEQTEAGTLLKEGRGAYRRSSNVAVRDVHLIQ